MAHIFPPIYTRIPGRAGEQRILTITLTAPSYTNLPPTPFAEARSTIAQDWGIDIEVEDITLYVTGGVFGQSVRTLISTEEEWNAVLDRLNKTTEVTTFTLCLAPDKVSIRDLNIAFERDPANASNAESTSSLQVLESLKNELTSLKVLIEAKAPPAMPSSGLAEILATLRATSDAYAAQALELATLKLAHQATKNELVKLKDLHQVQAQHLAFSKAACHRKTFAPQQPTDVLVAGVGSLVTPCATEVAAEIEVQESG